MKKLSITLSLLLGSGLLLLGQNANPPGGQQMGRGRGGAPFAWNDKNKDGVCDITGQPAGQGRGMGAMRGGRGRGAAAFGRGMGRGMGRGFRAQQQAAPPAAQK